MYVTRTIDQCHDLPEKLGKSMNIEVLKLPYQFSAGQDIWTFDSCPFCSKDHSTLMKSLPNENGGLDWLYFADDGCEKYDGIAHQGIIVGSLQESEARTIYILSFEAYAVEQNRGIPVDIDLPF